MRSRWISLEVPVAVNNTRAARDMAGLIERSPFMFKKIASLVSLTLVAALALMPAALDAQQASPGAAVSQTGSTGLAAQQCLATGTAMSTSAAQTLTVPSPGGGNSIYFDYLLATLNTIAAPASSANGFAFTTTNIAGTPPFPLTRLRTAVSGGHAIVAAGAPGPPPLPNEPQ